MFEIAAAHGVYIVECHDKDGTLRWSDTIENVVTSVGKNLALDSYLGASGGSAPGGTGPYMGLIDASGFTAVAAADSMGSHSGWSEFTGYSGTRKTCAWSAASSGSKALSASLTFSVNSTGVIQGGFIVYGSGAVNTISDPNGILYSCGQFSGGSKSVSSGDSISVSFTASL